MLNQLGRWDHIDIQLVRGIVRGQRIMAIAETRCRPWDRPSLTARSGDGGFTPRPWANGVCAGAVAHNQSPRRRLLWDGTCTGPSYCETGSSAAGLGRCGWRRSPEPPGCRGVDWRRDIAPIGQIGRRCRPNVQSTHDQHLYSGCPISLAHNTQRQPRQAPRTRHLLLAHEFIVTSDVAELQYKCTDCCAPECEGSSRWDDAELGIDWSVDEKPLVYGKDSLAPCFRDAETFV